MNDHTFGMSFDDTLSALLKCDEHIAEEFVHYYAERLTEFIINSDAPFFTADVRYNFEIYSFIIKSAYKVLTISRRNPPKRLGRRSTYTPLYTIEV